jgi:hypothetical protein
VIAQSENRPGQDQSPAEQLTWLVLGPHLNAMLSAVAEVGVADCLKEGPRSSRELSPTTANCFSSREICLNTILPLRAR